MKAVFENTDKVLVAYFSWSGNTRMIAQQIRNLTGGQIFEIAAVDDYSKVYREVVDRARQEHRNGVKPALKNELKSFPYYETVFIGYPNWCNTFPAPVLTFLSENDFAGKTIIPFCTHGGGGAGYSFADIRKQCPTSEVLDGFTINGYAVSRNNPEIEEWLKKLEA